VFVTHDIDEAVKLGDQVAVLRVGGTVAQLADPGSLLADPQDDFVADFVGRDRGYRGLGFRHAPTLQPHDEAWVMLGDEPSVHARGEDTSWLLVVDDDRRPLGWVEPGRISGPVSERDLHRGGTVAAQDGTARSVLDSALSSPSGRGVVVDGDGVLVGTVTAAEVVEAMEGHRGRGTVREHIASPADNKPGAG
jgi:osmoprotectant transport system ATP-binding protein